MASPGREAYDIAVQMHNSLGIAKPRAEAFGLSPDDVAETAAELAPDVARILLDMHEAAGVKQASRDS